MSVHFPALVIVIPLMAAFLILIGALLNKRLAFPLTALALLGSLLTAIGLLVRVMQVGVVEYHLAGWAPPVGIAYRVDHLNGLVLVAVSAVAFINLLGTRPLVAETFRIASGPFYTLYILMVTGLLGIVVTGDAFNLYVLLEIAALTGYALMGMGEGRAPLSSLNYIFMGTVGASFYLLGVGYLYLVTGTLNMADLAVRLPALYPSKVRRFRLCYLPGRSLYQDGFFPAACLVAQCLFLCAGSGQQSGGAPYDQGHDLRHDADHAVCLHAGVCLRPDDDQRTDGVAGRRRHRGRLVPGPVNAAPQTHADLHRRGGSGLHGRGVLVGQPLGNHPARYCILSTMRR